MILYNISKIFYILYSDVGSKYDFEYVRTNKIIRARISYFLKWFENCYPPPKKFFCQYFHLKQDFVIMPYTIGLIKW